MKTEATIPGNNLQVQERIRKLINQMHDRRNNTTQVNTIAKNDTGNAHKKAA